MRIVVGEWKGRRIVAPTGKDVRPTADKVREAWMSIVHPMLAGARVLDLFAGSGALGLEALSRGAVNADFVEIAPPSLRALQENIDTLGAEERAFVHRADALAFVKAIGPGRYDITFADPPYGQGMAAHIAETWLANPFSTLLSVEHAITDAVPSGGDTRRYGSTALTLYLNESLNEDRE